MITRIFQVALRTSDVGAARAFYTAVLGELTCSIVQLHEQAVARGARPHWIGFLEVTDVEAAAAAFIQRGATALGPTWVNPEGLEAAILRDPGGAIVAVAKPPAPARAGANAGNPRPHVAWYVLNTNDVERAKRNYAELFGWQFHAPLELRGGASFFPFGWTAGEPSAGAVGGIEQRPGVHPHWLFHFRVAALEPALDAVRAGGGQFMEPITLPGEDRIAVCDDPQGAAFALYEAKAG